LGTQGVGQERGHGDAAHAATLVPNINIAPLSSRKERTMTFNPLPSVCLFITQPSSTCSPLGEKLRRLDDSHVKQLSSKNLDWSCTLKLCITFKRPSSLTV
jgi:FAD synthase